MQKNLTRLALGALLTAGAALSGVAFSQAVEPVVAEISGSQLAGEVMVVNTETRLMTLKDADGVFHVLHVPPEVSRIDEIKIGDTVTITEISSALIGLTFMMVLASPPIMKDTLRMCRRTGAEVAKVFEGFWTAKANSTRRPSLVPRIAWHSRVAESGQRTLKRAVRLT